MHSSEAGIIISIQNYVFGFGHKFKSMKYFQEYTQYIQFFWKKAELVKRNDVHKSNKRNPTFHELPNGFM